MVRTIPTLLRGVLKHPGCDPRPIEVQGDLETLQACVGGYIERVTCPADQSIDLWINGDGRLVFLPMNLAWPTPGGDVLLVGSVLALGRVRDDSASLTPVQVDDVGRWMRASKMPPDRPPPPPPVRIITF